MKNVLSFVLVFAVLVLFCTPCVFAEGETSSEVIDLPIGLSVSPEVEEDILSPDESVSLVPEVPQKEASREEDFLLPSLFSASYALSVPYSYGNDFPSDSPLAGGVYIEAVTSELGEVLIFIPSDYQFNCLTFDSSGNLFNLRASTITGFLLRGSTQYDFRLTSFNNPTYRLRSGSSSYSDLTITDITNTNVVFADGNSSLPTVVPEVLTQYILIFLVLVVVFCLFIRRF